MLNKNKLATAVMAVISTASADYVVAQEPVLEEVVVTGIRKSLIASVDRKRESKDIMDSIVAEDIGKFPDSNVAESLQRISGVSIDRSGGEGQSVTVRGFGPQFNTVLVNGRRIASDTGGRGFNFDLIPADLIGGADVFKSSAAELQEGGIGSTINLRLQRPLDIGEFTSVVSARGVYDEQADELAPQLFGLVSNTFADEKLGVLLSASFQSRETSNDQVDGGPFLNDNFDATRRATVFANGVGNAGVDDYVHQQQTNFIRANEERDRFGLTGVIQFEPTDSLRFTIDGLYTKFEVEADSISSLQFNEIPAFHNAVADENNVITRYDQIGRPFNVFLAKNRNSELYQFGGNVEWDITDSLTASFDASTSKAKDDNAGKDFFVVVAGDPAIQRYDNTSGLDAPVATNFAFTPSTTDTNGDGVVDQFDYVLGDAIVTPDPANQSSWFSQREGVGNEDEISEFKLDLKWEADEGYLRSVSGGGYFGKQEKEHTDAHTGSSNVIYLDRVVPIPANLLTADTRSGYLSPVSGSYPAGFLSYDAEQVLSYLQDPATLALRDSIHGLPAGTSAAELGPDGLNAVEDLGRFFLVEEEITSFYVNFEFGAEFGEMELNVNAGMRYSKTDATSNAFSEQFLDLKPNASRNDVLSVSVSDAAAISDDASYDNWLPTLNARLRVNDNVILRAAYSKTLTRPNLNDLSPGITTPQEVRLSNLTGDGGNPALEPYESENWDFSSEFYLGEATLFSLGLFNKNIEGFIVRGGALEAITVPTPNSLSTITEDRSNIDGNDIFFEITRPRNLEDTSAYGAEISFQHTFDYLPGFLQFMGINANLTFVRSSDEFDASNADNSVVLPGLGDSRNFVLFYDDSTFEARIAFNDREKFFTRLQGVEPVFTEQYDQLDARFAWNVNDSYQVFLEGTNLTESYTRQVGRFDSRFGSVEAPGARYTLGVRANF